ncbi:cytochrome c family protein [Pseudomonas cavernae]|uniref:Cytochrome c family protein n=1 Tax=Pseudomonas cavernae TaxID=2320867 RepID=A0A385YXT7_9PSED|nr:multiheme c-type cytochrome [Pseudomonas cavernae]AYC31536.1 cytochrome c family protein [Pseudomonas cavernae]
MDQVDAAAERTQPASARAAAIGIASRSSISRLLYLLACLFTAALAAAGEPQGNGNQGDDKWLEPARSRLMGEAGGLPFFPHRANTTDNAVLKVQDFDDAQVCGACHTEIYKQWRSSMMAQSWEEPLYRALLKQASEATDGKVDNFCTGCHTPIGLTTGQITSAVNRSSIEDSAKNTPMPGVDCETCHNISARTGLDNGAYVLSPRANGKPTKFGPRKDAVSPYHDTVYSPLHTRSDFCATCHNVTHPFSSVAVERTYDEWLESPYSLNGETCQSCHMPGFAGKAAVMGPDRENVASHWFSGANATLLTYLGQHESAQRARDMLARAGEIQFQPLPAAVAPGRYTTVAVKVANVGAGHKLPTGFPEGREMWIDFRVQDASGREIYRLGAVKDGKTEDGTRNFKVRLGDKDGHELDVEVWNATQILSDSRILPKGYDVREFAFLVPADAVGPLSLSAELNYWPFSQKLADYLLGKGKLQVEITRMAKATQSLPLSAYVAEGGLSAPSPCPDRRTAWASGGPVPLCVPERRWGEGLQARAP